MDTDRPDSQTDSHSTTDDRRSPKPAPENLPESTGPATDAGGSTGAPELRRRDYLKAVGAAGIAGSLAGAGADGVAAQSDWEAEADARIEEHRTADLEVEVVSEDGGAPIPDAEVSVEMQEHDFGFGTAVDANELLNSSDGDPYREHLLDLFNKAVLENAHKWRFWEDNQQRADDATQWLLDHEFEVRGHTCVWGARQHSAVPADVETAIDNRNEQTIRERSMQHIEDIISHYGDDIVEWDVVNEALHEHSLQVGVYGDQIDLDRPWEGDVVPWTSELLADWYEHAEQVADQYGVDIAVNDYNTLDGWGYTRDWYPAQVEHLVDDNGIDLDSVGFQGHAQASTGEVWTDGNNGPDPDGRLSFEQLNDTLSLYEEWDVDLKVTEFDTYEGDDWGRDGMTADEDKAETLRTYLKTMYAHPQATDFLIWGYWDGNHWQNDAPLFYQDWSRKPAYDVWDGLVFGEWWTDESGTTGSDGTYTATAFLGKHDIRVTTSEGEATRTVEVTEPDPTTITVEAPGQGQEQCESAETAEVDGQTVCDLDGDGDYRDVNGDGEVGQDDVVHFFERQHRDAWKQPDLFDFSDSNSVGHGDVVSLFEYVSL